MIVLNESSASVKLNVEKVILILGRVKNCYYRMISIHCPHSATKVLLSENLGATPRRYVT